MVDDDRIQLHVLKRMLERQGFATHIVNDSREAIAQIRRQKPKVVLLDINMPHLDGYQVARQIRDDDSLAETLIVAVSTITGPEHERKATAAGIDLQLTKPVGIHELKSTIADGLAQREK